MAHRVTVRRGTGLATLSLGVPLSPQAETEEARAGPMCAGDHAGDGGERAIALVLIEEAVVQHEDAMGLAAPLAHEPSSGLLPGAGLEGDLTRLRHGPRESLEPPPHSLAQATIGPLLDLVSDRALQQVAAQPPGRRRPIKPLPFVAQLST